MATPTQIALSVEGVQTASFNRKNDEPWSGVVWHECGVEFDVRQDGRVWNVNDDDGRDYRAGSLKHAIRKAVRAQR